MAYMLYWMFASSIHLFILLCQATWMFVVKPLGWLTFHGGRHLYGFLKNQIAFLREI